MTTFANAMKRIGCTILCTIIVATSMLAAAVPAHAIQYNYDAKYAPSLKWYNNNASNSYGPGKGTYKQLSKCVPGVKSLGEAFVHGGNGVVDKSDGNGAGVSVQCYVKNEAARGSVTIQGKKIDKGWIIRGNIQHLWNLHHTPSIVGNINYAISDKNIGWPSDPFSYEFFACEGEKFEVVGYDDEWVYIWSTGLKGFENNSTGYCKNWLLLRTHPAGFYKISRDSVWLNIFKDDTYAKSSAKVYGEGHATIPGTELYQKAGKTETGPCYQVAINTKLEVMSSKTVSAKVDGKTKKYYKVRFKGKNDTYYMGYRMYYLYVESKYINVYKYDKKGKIDIPKNAVKAYIKKPSVTTKPELIYTSKSTKSTKFNAAVGDGAKVYVDPKKSNDKWVAIQFNDKIGYVQISRIQYYIDEMKLLDIKDNKFVVSWGKVPAQVTTVCVDKNGKKITNFKTYPKNQKSIVVDNAVFKGREGYGGGVTVAAGVVHTKNTASMKLIYPAKPFSLIARGKTNNSMTIAGVTEGGELWYSTSKNFKKYKSIIVDSNAVTVKGLSKNKTYYFKFCNRLTYNTEKGKKVIRGDWSETIQAKTTNITMKTPSIKTPIPQDGYTMIYWNAYSGTANRFEIVAATDKNFKKNVRKTVAMKSMTAIGIDGLKAKKTYYVKMRAVYTISDQTYYSKWSSVKTFKSK